MTHVRVNPTVLAGDGDDLHSIASDLRSYITSVTSSLAGSSGMAGDDNSAEDFAEFYDTEAPKVIEGAASMVTVLRALDAAITGTARAYKQAEMVGALKDPSSCSITVTAPGEYSARSIPNCLGGDFLPGPFGGEFQELIEDALAAAGVVIPTGNVGKLRSAATAWDTFSSDLTKVKSSVSSSFSAVQSMDIPQKAAILACRTRVVTLLGDISGNADAMYQGLDSFAENVEKTREELMWMVGQMVAEIMLDIGIGLVLGPLTAGLGTAAMMAKASTTIARWIVKIAMLINKLKTWVAAQKLFLRGLLRAVAEGAQSAVA